MKHPPLVSIVMPTLNQARFIREALENVLNQDYHDIELIVADGGSTDETLEILKAKQSQDNRLRWSSEPDNGPAQALNRALSRSRGTVIGWLNSDDLYAAGAISRAISAFQTNPEWLMVYGQGQHIDADGNLLERYPTLPPSVPIGKFSEGCFLCQPTVFFRRTQTILLGKLDESLNCAFDVDYWIRAFLAFSNRIGFIDVIQAYSRFHNDSITLRQRRNVMLEGMQVLARHFGHAPKEWVLTYMEELIEEKIKIEADSTAMEQAFSFLEDARSTLYVKDFVDLKTSLDKDPRLAAADHTSPATNAALAMDEFRKGVVHVRSTPKMLTLETTSRCNLRCVMCPHAINAVQRPKHLEENLVALLDRFIRRATSIQLHGIGEPIVSPAFWRIVPILPAPQVCESSINSNLTILSEARLKNILDSNLKIINVSLDAATAATYQKIRGFSLDTVLANLERLLAARHERNQKFPLVYLNMTLMKSNIDELQDFVRLAARLGVNQVVFWHLNRWSEAEMARYIIERDGWVFDYAQEGLWNYPELSNRCIREAVALGAELGMPLHLDHNKEVYYGESR